MAHHTAFPHLFLSLADQCVLVSVQFDVVANCLVDQIAARTVLRGSQRIKRLDLFGNGTEADGFLGARNTVTVPCIILYYKALSQGSITLLRRIAHPLPLAAFVAHTIWVPHPSRPLRRVGSRISPISNFEDGP